MNCEEKLSYVCKLDLVESYVDWDETDPRGDIIPCSAPWDTFGHHCYLPMKNKEMVTWATAEYMCRELDHNAHLPPVNSISLG